MRRKRLSSAWLRATLIGPWRSTGTSLPMRPVRPASASIPGRWAERSGACGRRAKKKTPRAAEQNEAVIAQARQDWRIALEAIAPERLIFLDESAALTNMVRTHAWSPRGTRAYGAIPCGHWTRLTMPGALGTEGIVAAMSIEAATAGAVFYAFLDQALPPVLRQLKPDAVLVMDNLSAHKAKAVRELLDRSGFSHHYWPSYTSERNH